jgi:hypothetical protein
MESAEGMQHANTMCADSLTSADHCSMYQAQPAQRAVLANTPVFVLPHLQGLQVLGVVLRLKAAFSAGMLLAWVLQRPELIDLSHTEPPSGTTHTLVELFYESSRCLIVMAVVLVYTDQDRSRDTGSTTSIGTFAAAMTQQLEQSGALQMKASVSRYLDALLMICARVGNVCDVDLCCHCTSIAAHRLQALYHRCIAV